MKNTKTTFHFEKLLSFLQGASWALAIAGGGYTFILFLPFGLIVSAMIGLFFFLAGVFFVVVFEIAFIQMAKLKEMEKQTALLERCIAKNNETLSHH